MLSNWLDVSSSSNRYQQMYIKGFLDISGGNLILRNNNFHLLKGDASLNGRLLVNGDASLNGNITVGKDLIINGRLYTTYADNSIPITAIEGGIPGTSGVFLIDLSLNRRLYVQNDVSLNSNLYVSKTAYFNSDLSINNRLFVKGNVNVSNLFATGTGNINTLRATNIYENGTLIYTKYATINSPTFTGTVNGITSTMVGLGNVNNTSDLDKPISTATQNALNLLVASNSPSLTGIPTAPTASIGNNSTQIATTGYVITGISGLIGTAPAKLSTLAQIASAINNDASYNITLSNKFAPLSSPYFINNITTPKLFVTSDSSLNGKVFISNDASLNSNLFVGKSIYEGGVSLINKYATLASPTFTGSVTMPNVIINQNLVNNGDVSMNNRLYVGSDSSFNSNLYVGKNLTANGDTTMNSKLIVKGDVSLNSNLIIGKDLTVNGNLVVNTYTSQQTVTATSYQFIIAEDMSLNGKLSTSDDVSMNKNLYLGRDASINGNLFINGNTKINGFINVNTPATSDNSTLVATTEYVKNQGYSKLSGSQFTGDVSMNSNLQVVGNLVTNTPATSDNSTLVATTEYVKNQGYSKLSGSQFTGDVSMNSNLQVVGNLVTNTPATSDNSTLVATTEYVQNKLTVFKASPTFSGDATMDYLTINNNTSIHGNLHVNTKTILDNDVSMNKNLDLSGSIIAHSNMNLYGIINQYTTTLDQGYIVNYSNINASGDLIANGVTLNNSNSKNTFFGMTAGNSITTGLNNTFIGYGSGLNVTSGSNNINIGYGSQSSIPSISNEITLGNNSITTLRCNTQTITSLSDIRDKKNIQDIPLGLNFINNLHPVEFEWNARDGSRVDKKEFGFIAQELKSSQEIFGINVPNLIYEENPDRLEASYGVLIPIMVKAIKELTELTAKQQLEINELKSKLSA
jgi:cytoskeletal protein CcmA (bactofilin family)